MAVPHVIPIAYQPKHRTDSIGRYADGQFLASVTYAFPEGFRPAFGVEGRYRDSEIWCAGTWAEQQRTPAGENGENPVLARARAHLAKLLRSLPRRAYTDIAIRPFRLTVDGVLFGLLTGEDEGEHWAELYPDRLGFGEPWDGRYDT